MHDVKFVLAQVQKRLPVLTVTFSAWNLFSGLANKPKAQLHHPTSLVETKNDCRRKPGKVLFACLSKPIFVVFVLHTITCIKSRRVVSLLTIGLSLSLPIYKNINNTHTHTQRQRKSLVKKPRQQHIRISTRQTRQRKSS